MRRTTVLLLCCCVTFAAAGCRSVGRSSDWRDPPILVPQPKLDTGLGSGKKAKKDEAGQEHGRRIVFMVFFVNAWPRGRLKELGLAPKKWPAVLPLKKRDKLFRAVKGSRDAVLMVTAITVSPGRKGRVAVLKDINYVQDYRFVGGPGPKSQPLLEPVSSEVRSGLIVEIDATIEGDTVILKELVGKVVTADMRLCSARVMSGGKPIEVIWQEPLVLKSRCDLGAAAPLKLKPGESVALRFRRFELVRGTANVRLLALGRQAHEKAKPWRDSDGTGRLSRLGIEAVMVVTADEIVGPDGE